MRILISHSFKPDGQFAEKLSASLRSSSVEPQIDNLKAVCGENDGDCLQREIRRRYDYVIPVFSAHYMRDKFLQLELFQSLALEQSLKGKFVLPVMVGKCNPYPHLLDRIVDFRNLAFEDGFARLKEQLTQSRQIFVVMKFGDKHLDSTYNTVIRDVIREFGFSPLRIDEITDSGVITDQILTQLRASVCVLADLTGQRPNCYFEVGYALALEKELILSARRGEDVHFDLANRRYIEWETPQELKDALRTRLADLAKKHALPSPPRGHSAGV